MYQVGELVIYGIHGICRITAQEERILDRKPVKYLVLEPVGQNGSRYMVPTHNETVMAKISPVLTPEQMKALLSSDEVRRPSWIRDENLRKNTYRELITSGNRAALLQMVYTLYAHKKAQLEAGKKMHLADDNFLRDAEKILTGEIAVVMGCTTEQARNYLRERLQSE